MYLAWYVECVTAANVCSISQLVFNTQSTVLVTVLSTNATFLVAFQQKEKMGHELFSGHGMAQLAPLTSTCWLINMTIREITGFTNSKRRDKIILAL